MFSPASVRPTPAPASSTVPGPRDRHRANCPPHDGRCRGRGGNGTPQGSGGGSVVSTFAGRTLEDIASPATAPLWLHVYSFRACAATLVGRAERAGFETLVLTADAPGWAAGCGTCATASGSPPGSRRRTSRVRASVRPASTPSPSSTRLWTGRSSPGCGPSARCPSWSRAWSRQQTRDTPRTSR
jgi:hypothetical protein